MTNLFAQGQDGQVDEVAPRHFSEAVTLAVADNQPWSRRAAWILWSCMESDDRRIRRHVGNMIDILEVGKYIQLRELLMILQRMAIPESNEGRLFDAC